MAAKSAPFPLNNSNKPKQGTYGLVVPLDFTTTDNVAGDLSMEQQTGLIEFVQSVWIDNSLNTKALKIVFGGTQYTLNVRAGRCGIFPIIAPAGILRFAATSVAAAVIVPTIFANFELPYFFWDV